MHIKYYLSFIFLILHSLFAETYPLAQKPFLETIGTSDKFERGTFLIVIPEDIYEQYLSIEYIGNFIGFKKTQGYDVEVWNFENIGSANNLRDRLKVYYDQNNLLEYVLLIGDYDPDSQISNPIVDSYTISSYNENQEDVTDHPFTYFNGSPETDDGLYPHYFIGRWSIASNNDENLLIPCTPYGCLLMLKGLGIQLSGKNAIVIGRSNIVGKPMAQLLLKESCTVTIAHSKTKNLPEICRKADIVVAAVGKPEMVKGDWIKKGAIVIDVGINRIETEINGKIKTKLVGDVKYADAEKNALAITPVPGGVGPMTIACLLRNTTIAFKNSR